MDENFPPLDIFSPDDDVTIKNLIVYLEEYQRRRSAILQETDSLKQQFYIKLRDIFDENERIRQEANEYKSRLEQREKDQLRSDSKIKALEKIINTNSFKTPMSSNKENRPSQFATPSVNNSTNNTNYLLNSASSNSQQNSDGLHTPITSTFRSSRITTTTQSIGRTVALTSNVNAAPPPLPPQTPSSSSSYRYNSVTNSGVRLQTPRHHVQQMTQQFQQSASKEGAIIGNRRAARRSKSAEMWLDHKPATSAKLDTVMQPKMDRKKSVSKLELSDTKKSTKYLLTHQQQDQDGEIVTNLIKGNILKSPSGGANVVFTDIETLLVKAQEPAKPIRKRASEDNEIEDKLTIEDRVI